MLVQAGVLHTQIIYVTPTVDLLHTTAALGTYFEMHTRYEYVDFGVLRRSTAV